MRTCNKRELFRRLGYEPSPGQWQFHESTARFRVLIAGSRFGKSLAAAREVLPVALRPNTRSWICGPTYALAEKEMRYVIEDLHTLIEPLGITPRISGLTPSAAGRCSVRLPWGSEIVTKSAKEPYTLLGDEIDLLIVSEASRVKRQVWESFLRARLGSRRGQLIIPTTPAGRGDWVHELYERGLDGAHREWQSFGPFAVIENPTFPPDEWQEARATLPPEVFAEQWEGRFVRRSGLVYPEFDRAVHVIDDDALPRNWRDYPVWRAIDFGYTNPFVCLWVVQLPDAWCVVDELHERNLLLSDAAVRIHDRSRGLMIRATIADHDAVERATLRQHGVPTRRAVKTVFPGIERVKRLLMPVRGDHPPDANCAPRPRLLVHRRCRATIHEFETYAWEPSQQDDQRNDQPLPRKFHDHAMDALRYLLMTVPHVLINRSS